MSIEAAPRAAGKAIAPMKTMLARLRPSRDVVLPAATFATILIVWQLGCTWGGVPSWLLPTPIEIVQAGAKVPLGNWIEHIVATTRVIFLGFLLAVALSAPLAVALSRSETARLCIYPILVVIQSTPVVAIAPILVVTLGAGDAPRVLVAAIITFFPMVVGIATGLSQTPPELIELSRSLGAPERNEYLHVRLPYALTNIFAAARVGITLSVIGAVVGEFVASDKGIGYLIRSSTAYFDIAQAFAALLVLIMLGLVLFQSVNFVQKIFFPRSVDRTARSIAGR